MNLLYGIIFRISVLLAITLVMPMNLLSQKFIMNTSEATYNATCGGVIKMKSKDASIEVNNGNNFGQDNANAIMGVVDWNAGDATQTVQGFYYERLVISGNAAKTVEDGVFIVGISCPTPLDQYANLANYPFYISNNNEDVTFQGTFTYASDSEQSIYPVSDNGDTYNNLELTGTGTKTIEAGDIIPVSGLIALDVSSELDVEGTINAGASNSTLDGTVNISGDGIFNAGDGDIEFTGELTVDGTTASLNGGVGNITYSNSVIVANSGSINGADGDMTFDATIGLNDNGQITGGSGLISFNDVVTVNGAGAGFTVGDGNMDFNDNINLTQGSITAPDNAIGVFTVNTNSTLNLSSNNSVLDFGAATNLVITGVINNSGDGTNLAFDCSSTVTYNGVATQEVMPTILNNSYGNLVLNNGNKLGGTESYGSNFYLCGDFAYDAGVGGGIFDIYKNNVNPGTIFMTNAENDMLYTGDEEVKGTITRTTDAVARTYTYHNKNTQISLDDDANNPTDMTLFVNQGVNSNPNYNASSDVNRTITLSYNATNDFELAMKLAYLESEGPDAGNWTAPYEQNKLRLYEADNDETEKIGTGSEPVRTPASGSNLGAVELAGLGRATANELPNGIGLFASGNDVLLRSGPTTFYSIAAGRWTNPNTWDEGIQPTENDNVEVRHLVYVGIDGPFAGTDGGADNVAVNNTLSEFAHYGSDAAAYEIVIAEGTGDPNVKPALILGNEDNGNNYIFKTAKNDPNENSFTNNNTSSPTLPIASNKAAFTQAGVNGLWITSIGINGASIPYLQSFRIENNGSVFNEGIIEVGE